MKEVIRKALLRLQEVFWIADERDLTEEEIDVVTELWVQVFAGKMTPQVSQLRMRERLGEDGLAAIFPNEDYYMEVQATIFGMIRAWQQLETCEREIFAMANPAWRLTRVGYRENPRQDWQMRWQAAGDTVGWEGAIKGNDFVALKDSPIWRALGEGAGGFDDALQNSHPPFAFGSGMGWVNVGCRECKNLGLVKMP